MRGKLLLLSIVIVLYASIVPASAIQVWDAGSAISATNGSPNVWTYGYAANVDPGYTVTKFDSYYTFDAYNYWIASASGGSYSYILYGTGLGNAPYNFVGLGMCPGEMTGAIHYTILRWTAPAPGSYGVYLGLEEIDWGDEDIRVLVNGTEIFTHHKPNRSPDLIEFTSDEMTLVAGDTIDVALGPGDAYVNDWMKGDVRVSGQMADCGIVHGFVRANTSEHTGIAEARVETLDVTPTSSTVTGINGEYTLYVPPGTYSFRASIDPSHLSPKTASNVIVGLNQTIELDFDLDLHTPTTYYVKTDGDDSKDGLTRANAWKTIQNANVKGLVAGDTVKVAPGTYPQTDPLGVKIETNGYFTDKVEYVRDDGAGPGNVVIDMTGTPLNEDNANAGMFVDADYVSVDGFEVKNATWGIILMNGHHDNEVANCEIHGIRPAMPAMSAIPVSTVKQYCGGINPSQNTNAVIRNNLIYDIGYPELPFVAACVAAPGCTNLKVYNNTLADAQSGIATWAGGDNGLEFKNNIVTGMRGYGIDPSFKVAEDNGEITRTNNFYFANTTDFGWANPTLGAGEYNCNPQFAPSGYTLAAGSPAINAGVDVSLPYQGSAPDIGAFETSSSAVANAILQGTVTANVTGHPGIARTAISVNGTTLGATDGQGDYKFPVTAGTYNLTADRGGVFAAKPGSVTVAAGGTATKDFDLDMGTGSTYYINADTGDDVNNDGTTPSSAWATIDHGDVAGLLKPGDTVMVAGGAYPQTAAIGASRGVRINKCFGDPVAPITYKADGNVVIDQDSVEATDNTNIGIDVDADNIVLCGNGDGGQFMITNCQYGVMVGSGRTGDTVANCNMTNIIEPGIAESSYRGWSAGVCADGSVGTTVRNNVFANIGDLGHVTNPSSAVMLKASTDAKVYNNTMDTFTRGVYILNGSKGSVVRNNIFSYIYSCALESTDPCIHSNNFFSPVEAAYYGGLVTPGVMEFAKDNDVIAFADLVDFHLLDNSPAINMGMDVGLPFEGEAPDLGAHETSVEGYPDGLAIVEGTVRYRSSGQPVDAATVVVEGMSNSCVTGADGAYGFVLDPGNWVVTALKHGYASKSAELVLADGTTTTQDFYLSLGGGAVWDLAQDFSIVENPNGQWSYWVSTTTDPLSVSTLLASPDDFGTRTPPLTGILGWWRAQGDAVPLLCANVSDVPVFNNVTYPYYFAPHAAGLHPGSGSDSYCVARWTAPYDGAYEVYAVFGDSWYTHETVDYHLYATQSGAPTELLNGVTPGGTTVYAASYAGKLSLMQGDTLDAFVGPGSNGNGNDMTPVAFRIVCGINEVPIQAKDVHEAKQYGDNTRVSITDDQVVTVGSGTFSDGSCYIESPDRTSGIKVVLQSGVSPITKGQKIKLQGVMGTDDNGERFISVESCTTSSGGVADALGMTNKAVGSGLSGLLVRVWGKVVEVGPNNSYAVINDGSGSAIKVVLNAATITDILTLDKTVGITGPVGFVADGPTLTTVVRARSDADIVVYN